MSGYEGADEVVGAVVDGIHVVFGIVPFVKDENDVGCGIGKQLHRFEISSMTLPKVTESC